VLARAAALQRGAVEASESFSETHLYFVSLVETASATLDDVRRIVGRERSLDSDTLRRQLSQEVMGLDDGGEWEWAFGLIEKYGLVPARGMRETASSKDTKAMRVDLHERFARAARAIAHVRAPTAGSASRRCATSCASWSPTWAPRRGT